MLNLSASIAYHARQAPERPAILYEGKTISYGEFERRILRLAAFLHAHSIGADDVVALFMKNSPAFLEIAYAASYLGAVFLPINYRLAASEAEYILKDAEAGILFVDEEFAEVGRLDVPVVLVDAAAQGDSSRLVDRQLSSPAPALRGGNDLVRLMYTSGTTSRPKGVMHTYDNFYWKSIDHVIALGLTRNDRLLVVGPLYHVGAFDLPGVAVLWIGGTLCVHRRFDPEQALKSIEEFSLSCAWMAPAMLGLILAVENPERYDLGSFRWCIAGGEKTPESRIRDFTRVFRSGRFIDAYGLTESCSGDTLMEPGRELEKIGSTGRPTPHVEIRIFDFNGNPLPAGKEGEICLRGPKVTKGYWKAPQKTRESFYDDWFRTGDIGFVDEEGFLFMTDRAKDMITTGAENVASSEVENILYQLPEVVEAAVIGAPDEKWGERIVAVVVTQPGANLSLERVREHCGRYLAKFKLPKELHLVSELPRNPSGKILKRVLRDELADS